jgi:hypothetical protein
MPVKLRREIAQTEGELYDCQIVFHGAPGVGMRTYNAARGDESSLLWTANQIDLMRRSVQSHVRLQSLTLVFAGNRLWFFSS